MRTGLPIMRVHYRLGDAQNRGRQAWIARGSRWVRLPERRYKGNYYRSLRRSLTQNLVRIIDECPQELALLVLDAFVIR